MKYLYLYLNIWILKIIETSVFASIIFIRIYAFSKLEVIDQHKEAVDFGLHLINPDNLAHAVTSVSVDLWFYL